MSVSSYTRSPKTKERKDITRACKILANDARYQILAALLKARKEKKELCVNEISELIRMSQSATSHQLALLEAYGVIVGTKMGQTTCYDLTDSPLMKDIERIIRIGEYAL